MATTTKNYKQTSHLPRVIYTEPAPLSGMNYTNTPLQPGYAKIVYNLVENPEGTGLRARPGAKKVDVYSDILPCMTLINKVQAYEDKTRYYVSTERIKDTSLIKDEDYNYNRYTINYTPSEYGNIIHTLYKHNDFLYFYSKNKMENKEPYILGAPLIEDKRRYDPNTYCVSPIYSKNNTLISTKAFETNDIMLLCNVGRHLIKTNNLINITDANNETQSIYSGLREWFAYYYSPSLAEYESNKTTVTRAQGLQLDIDNNNTEDRTESHRAYYSKSSYNRYYEYSLRHTDPLSGDSPELPSIPDTLQIYYRVQDLKNIHNDNTIYIGFKTDKIIYCTKVKASEIKNYIYFEKEPKTPVVLYKLPSITVDDYKTKTIAISEQTPIYSIKITNIRLQANGSSWSDNFNYQYKMETTTGLIIDKTKFWIAQHGALEVLVRDNLNDILYDKQISKEAGGSFYQKVSISLDNLTKKDQERFKDFNPIDDKLENNLLFGHFAATSAGWQISYSIMFEGPISNNKYHTKLNLHTFGVSIELFKYFNLCRQYANDSELIINCPDLTISLFFEDYSDAPQEIKPKEPTIKEALLYGYNMLLANPYTFKGNIDGSQSDYIEFGGLLAYDKNDNIVLNPISNVNYKFKVIANTSASTTPACMLIDYKTVAQDYWTKINTGFETPNKDLVIADFSGQKVKDIAFNWTPNVTNAIIRIRFYAKTENELYNKSFATEEDLKTALSAVSDNSLDGTIFEVTSRSVPIYYQATYDSTNGYTTSIVYYPEAESEEESNLFAKGYRNILTNAITMSFERNYESNVNVKNYDFSTAQGMTYWYNRLIVWGVDSGSNILFFSDINDPSYFPYPNNISIFDEPVIKAVPFQDNLLVFTMTKIWKITLSEDGMSWYEECIQKNLRVTSEEAHLIIPLTNMVFFKSGLYYYLLTPSSKGTGELVIASISKPITDILQNPTLFFLELERQCYGNKHTDFNVIETNVYSDSSEIHIVYSYASSLFNITYPTETTVSIDGEEKPISIDINTLRNYILSYNINTRKWRVWSFDSDTVPKVLYTDAVNNAVWYVLSSRDPEYTYPEIINRNGADRYNNIYTFQFLSSDITDLESNKENIDDGIPGSKIFYQYLDTGNRDIIKEYYKKFREYQVYFNNRSNNDLKFYIEFSIDDNPIVPLYSGSIEPNSETGYIYDLNPESETTVYGTVLSLKDGLEYTIEGTMWDLFHLVKCKAPITSKGYCPALHILSKNTYSYDILDITWVYRLKNAR